MDDFSLYQSITPTVHIYLKDLKGRYLWANDAQIKSAGFASRHEIVGLTDIHSKLPWREQGEHLMTIDKEVIDKAHQIICYEQATSADNILRKVLTKKSPGLINQVY